MVYITEETEYINALIELEEIEKQMIREEQYICDHVNEADEEYGRNHEHDYECLKDLVKEYFDCNKEERENKCKYILNWIRTH